MVHYPWETTKSPSLPIPSTWQVFPITEIFVARPAEGRKEQYIDESLFLSRRTPFELLSPLGVVIFSKELVEFRVGSDDDYGCSRKAIDALTKRRGANDIEMDASYVPAISVLPHGFPLRVPGTLLNLLLTLPLSPSSRASSSRTATTAIPAPGPWG